MRFGKLSLAALFVLAASTCQAQTYDLAPPGSASFDASNIGQSRSFIFDAASTFSLSSVGIFLNSTPGAFSLTAELYSVNPGTLNRNSLLTTATTAETNNGGGFYDVALSTSLTAGNRYELNLFPPPNNPGFGVSSYNAQFYSFNAGFNAPFTVGPISVVDGAGDGNVGGPSNTVLAHFRITAVPAVPEPGSVALLVSIGATGAGFLRRRKLSRG